MRALFIYFLLCSSLSANPGFFIRGDVDCSGTLDITDVIILANGGDPCQCPQSGDFDEDGDTDFDDSVALFNFLFNGGPGPEDDEGICGG